MNKLFSRLFFTLFLSFISAVLGSTVINLSNAFCKQEIQVVDINRFTQLLSNHLLFDHFDKAYLQLSRKISYQFRDAIQVKVKKIKPSKSSNHSLTAVTVIQPPVDVQILKRQLKGAVGSFVEDKLPYILTNRYNTTSLQNQLDTLLYQYCQPTSTRTITQTCLLDHRELFLSEIHNYTSHELQSTLLKVNEFDLPRLFEKTRAQISGILIHFNQHTMDKNYHRLELKIKSASHPSHLSTSLASSKFRNWITPEMIQEFISTVNHTDNEEGHTINHFLELSK